MLLGRNLFRFAHVWIAGCCVALAACGDDDSDKPMPSSDGGVDASTDAGGHFIPRPDAAVATTDPIRACDQFDPNSCPSGQVCDVLVRLFPGQDQLTIYAGCVEKTRERGLGDPCDPDFTSTTPYQTKGLTDLVFRDQCGPGLICGADPKVRGGTSCQPACASGSFRAQPNPVLCSDPRDFCVGGGPFQEFCLRSDGCDVTYQTGCKANQACYLRPKDDLSGYLSVCFAAPAKPLADGAACETYNACKPGSSCNGPISKSFDQWQDKDIMCRPSCTADGVVPNMADADAGADDGGVSEGCRSPNKCLPFSKTGLSLQGITKPPYGQCE